MLKLKMKFEETINYSSTDKLKKNVTVKFWKKNQLKKEEKFKNFYFYFILLILKKFRNAICMCQKITKIINNKILTIL